MEEATRIQIVGALW
jgi:SWIB/MDM2 domain